MVEAALLVPLHEAGGPGAGEGPFPPVMVLRKPPALAGQAIRLADDEAGEDGAILRALAAVHLFQRGAQLADLKAHERQAEPAEHIAIADRFAISRLQDQQGFQLVCREQGHSGWLAHGGGRRYTPD